MADCFSQRVTAYAERVAIRLDRILPGAEELPGRLHQAMRYAVLNGGKRIRPLLVYATGECLGIPEDRLDPAAVAIELIHAFSLVHDDLPAMDDDDLRRGRPTVHRQFDEATAILAADALQPLAFTVVTTSPKLDNAEKSRICAVLAAACGSLGMTGGQSIDLDSEGRTLSVSELETMHRMKTGALIRASVVSAGSLARGLPAERLNALDRFADSVGLAFQIRDDILDVSGNTDVIGKTAGSDEAKSKATWPAIFGLEESRRRCDELLESAFNEIEVFGDAAAPLRWLARYIVERAH